MKLINVYKLMFVCLQADVCVFSVLQGYVSQDQPDGCNQEAGS
jgi:hypothetical protein